jgi:hypothetical protein
MLLSVEVRLGLTSKFAWNQGVGTKPWEFGDSVLLI